MRLKQYQKDRIVSTLTAVTFKDRAVARMNEGHRLALRVMESKITHKERDLMAQLPAKFFKRDTYLYAVAPREGRSDLTERLEFGPDVPVPFFLYGTSVVVEDADLIAEIEAYVDSKKALTEERDAFEKQTAGVVNSFRTSEKLLEAWPVIREIMPADYFKEPEKPQLPTTQINELDALVQGARPFETEAIAA